MAKLKTIIWPPNVEVMCGHEYLERIEEIRGVLAAEYSAFTHTVTAFVSRWGNIEEIAKEIEALGEESNGNQGTD